MAVNLTSLHDARLRRAVPTNEWRIGTAVEVFTQTEQRWNIGCIVELPSALSSGLCEVLFLDGHFGYAHGHRVKVKNARVGVDLASVATHICQPPPNFELGDDGTLLSRGSTRRCATFEEAWTHYFETQILPNYRVGTGAATARERASASLVKHSIRVQASTAAFPPARVPPGVYVPRHAPASAGEGVAAVATASASGANTVIVKSPGSYVAVPPTSDSVLLLQERDHYRQRAEAAEARVEEQRRQSEEQRRQSEEQKRQISELQSQLEDLRRDDAESRRDPRRLAPIRDEIDDSPIRSPVSRFASTGWLAGRDRGAGREELISFTIPRVLTEEEKVEEERRQRHSLGSLPAHVVTRLPSAPMPSMSQAAGHDGTHPLVMAPHRQSVVVLVTAGQHHQVAHSGQHLQPHRPAQAQGTNGLHHNMIGYHYRR